MKPSSLNYKIGLETAVKEFVKKESKIEDYEIMVEECPFINDDLPNEPSNKFNLQEDLDDCLY